MAKVEDPVDIILYLKDVLKADKNEFNSTEYSILNKKHTYKITILKSTGVMIVMKNNTKVFEGSIPVSFTVLDELMRYKIGIEKHLL